MNYNMKFNKIYVEITNICNLNCSFCSKDKRSLKEMSIEEFEITLQKIKNYTKTIYLHVKGEPLLHSKLETILELANNYNFNVRITTNGTLLKEKYNIIKKFSNIKQINVSLHSENNKKNYFEDIFKTSDILSTNIPIVYRIWTLDDFNLDKLSTFIVDKIIEHYHLDTEFRKLVINEKNIKIKNNLYLDKDNEFDWPTNESDNKDKFGSCLGTRTHIAILSNGDIVPCCLDSSARLKLGNIFNDNIEDILSNPLFIKINTGFKHNILNYNLCRNCNFRKKRIIEK